jgi:hypothetical protein
VYGRLARLPLLRRAARAVLDTGILTAGLGEYWLRGKMRPAVRIALLRLHCRTNGKATALLTPLVRALRPPRRREAAEGVLGVLSVSKLDEIAAAIARDGFHIFESRLSPSLCDEIEAYAGSTPAQIEESSTLALFDPQRPVSKTYRIREKDIVANRGMQELMADRSILAVAETYLKTLPVLSGLNLWFSPAFGNAPGDSAAQEFHFDFDPPPIWLLFFVYLTDVGPQNGPHVFVRGTHVPGNPGMKELLSRGYVRIPDEDIVRNFGAESIVELYGKRGTVLAVDTRGMHKGKMPVSGHRLMVQLSFTTPPFSTTHGDAVPLPDHIAPQLASALQTDPAVYAGRYHD